MVGKSVLLECLDSPFIEQVLAVNRRPVGITHPKLREVLVDDLARVADIREALKGYDACFFGMGVSAAGMREAEVRVKGPGGGRESAIRAVNQAGIRVTSIRDTTPIPHNGCRPPKRRRV